MDFDEPALVERLPEELADARLDPEDALIRGGPEVNEPVVESERLRHADELLPARLARLDIRARGLEYNRDRNERNNTNKAGSFCVCIHLVDIIP